MADSTREKILQQALQLFAEKGFAAVSMREIADAAGIRASSIYYYFTGKQAVFDALVERAGTVREKLKAAFLQAFALIETVERDDFVRAGCSFFTGYLEHPQVKLLLEVLSVERGHEPSAERAWCELLLEVPLEHERAVFEALSQRGLITDADASALAAEYHAIILLIRETGDMAQLRSLLERFYRRVFQEA